MKKLRFLSYQSYRGKMEKMFNKYSEYRAAWINRFEIQNVLMNPVNNIVRDSVRESRGPDFYNNIQCLRQQWISEIDKIQRGGITNEDNLMGDGDVYLHDPVYYWEIENNKFNAQLWIPTIKGRKITPEIIDKLFKFWDHFLEEYRKEYLNKKNEGDHPVHDIKVFDLLINRSKSNTNLTPEELKELQFEIEQKTFVFKEENIYESIPHLKGLFFKQNGKSAKDYLLEKLKDKDDLDIVRAMGTYTIECIAIFVLSQLFNVFSLENYSVQAARLIEDLDISVRREYKKRLPNTKGENHKKEEGYAINHKVMNNCTETIDDNIQQLNKVEGDESHIDILLRERREEEGIDNMDHSIKKKSITKKMNKSKKNYENNLYLIGAALFNWLGDNKIIDINHPGNINNNKKKNSKRKHIKAPSYVKCLFNIQYLPFCSHIPMVSPPIEWMVHPDKDKKNEGGDCAHEVEQELVRVQRENQSEEIDMKKKPLKGKRFFLNEFSGGYLTSRQKGRMRENSVKLITTKEDKHFMISVKSDKSHKLITALNKLQEQPYKINKNFYEFLQESWGELQRCGLLLPKDLASIDRKEGVQMLAELFYKNPDIREYFNIKELSNILIKNIQTSNFQIYIFKLAEALKEYKFYLPVFLDFRGRNYRYGPMHFHERDLVRSLILFAESDDSPADGVNKEISNSNANTFGVSTAFHYKKFSTYNDALIWGVKHIKDLVELEKANNPSYLTALFDYSINARHPFQYLSGVLSGVYSWFDVIKNTPINQDASASAYQLLSYFLLDKSMGIDTNLIQPENSNECKINDIYDSMLLKFKDHMKTAEEKKPTEFYIDMDNFKRDLRKYSSYEIVKGIFTRDIVKQIFMPLVYGKTEYSVRMDLHDKLSKYLPKEDITEITNLCFDFWNRNYKDMINLMDLINNVSWVAASHRKPVLYSTNYWDTKQDYFTTVPIKVKVQYESSEMKKKRSAVTLTVHTDKRNLRKTKTSTFANFIHQKDAFSAINFVNYIRKYQEEKGNKQTIPIYTVHDNFITTAEYASILPGIYKEALLSMGHPASIINKFIFDNIIIHVHDILEKKPSSILSREERILLDKISANIVYCYNYPQNNPYNIIAIDPILLEKCLLVLTPKTKSASTLKQWVDNSKKIVTCYEKYIQSVLRAEDARKRWFMFKEHLEGNSNRSSKWCDGIDTKAMSDDYSLHY